MADRYLIATGDWNDVNVWSASDGGVGGETSPVAGDNVFVLGAYTLTLEVEAKACGAMTLDHPNASVAMTTGSSLAVSGNLTVTGGGFTGDGGITCGGSVVGNPGAFVSYAGTLTLNATSGTPTVTSNAGEMPAMSVALGAGVTVTLADEMNCGVLTLVSGTLAAGANTITCSGFTFTNGTLTGSGAFNVNGNLVYTAGTNGHTGLWTQGTGNLAWNTSTQRIANYAVAAGNAVTMTNTAYVSKASVPADATVAIGATAFNVYLAAADNFATLLGTWTATTGFVRLWMYTATRSNSGAISIGSVTLYVQNIGAAATLTQTGPVTCGALNVIGYTFAVTKLTCGAITLGTTAAAATPGILNLGPTTQQITSVARGNAANVGNTLGLGSAYIVAAGTINATTITVTNTASFVQGGTVSNLGTTVLSPPIRSSGTNIATNNNDGTTNITASDSVPGSRAMMGMGM